MNDKIKQLADQCRETAASTEWPGEQWEQFNEEKFAKLIIAECGIALKPMLRDMISRGQAYNLIKEHFGFEE